MRADRQPHVDIALANVQTHECEFTRGYWLGFARATVAYWRGAFLLQLPAKYLDDLGKALPSRSLVVRTVESNGFGVDIAHVHVGPAEIREAPPTHLLAGASRG